MMINHPFLDIKNILHAQLCYQLFITPLPLPLAKRYRDFAKMACEYIDIKHSEIIHQEHPRHHVIYRFKQGQNQSAKKILITHGWQSRAAYMARIIRALHQQGYDVYAVDFPAHGEAKGLQLPWTDATAIIKQLINEHGPFYAAIGHSFGGSMLLNTLNLAGQLPEWQLQSRPERVVLIASPVQMRTPVTHLARKIKLSGSSYLYLRQIFREHTTIDPACVRLKHFVEQSPEVQFLCIHGTEDRSISPRESMMFCHHYTKAYLALLDKADHVSVLMDDRVERLINQFLESA